MRILWLALRGVASLFLVTAFACSKVQPPAQPLSDADMKSAAKQQANQCVHALLSGDYEGFAAFTYPKVMELMGGKDAMIQRLRDGNRAMQSDGQAIKSAEIGDTEQLRSSNFRQLAILPETLRMAVAGGTLRVQSYLLGVSEDGGRNWKFLDGAGLAKERVDLNAVVPNFPRDLSLPKMVEPTFEPDAALATSQASPMTIDRADYQLTVPSGSTVDSPSLKVDADHLTTVNLPNEHTLIVIVIDNARELDSTYADLQKRYRNTLIDPVQSTTASFDGRDKGRGTVIGGKINGVNIFFEVGAFTGPQKAYLITCTYTPDDRDQTRYILRQVIGSFKIKP